MISDTKAIIDTYFRDNWTETDIQFEGVKYESPPEKRWISLQTIPYDAERYGFDGDKGRRLNYYTETVRVFDRNPQKAFDLAQLVLNFFDCKSLGKLWVDMGIGDGNGAVNLDNDCYVVTINFNIKEFE